MREASSTIINLEWEDAPPSTDQINEFFLLDPLTTNSVQRSSSQAIRSNGVSAHSRPRLDMDKDRDIEVAILVSDI